jgi:histidine kinase
LRAVGKGTFGVVYEAEEYGTGRIVAVKKVFQDKNYKVDVVSVFDCVEPGTVDHEDVEPPQHCDSLQLLLLGNGKCRVVPSELSSRAENTCISLWSTFLRTYINIIASLSKLDPCYLLSMSK